MWILKGCSKNKLEQEAYEGMEHRKRGLDTDLQGFFPFI